MRKSSIIEYFLTTSSQSSTSNHHHTNLQSRFFPSSRLSAMMHSNIRPRMAILLTLLVAGLCANSADSSPTQSNRDTTSSSSSSSFSTSTSIRTQQCREGCFEKCWDECAKPPPPKINKSIRETWSLHTVSMLQQDSLVLVDVAWAQLSTPNQCLVTWEVSGGGLMGNLLTESFNVQLSLWPDTKYRVQVTCKNKLTGTMSRSLPLTIDTTEAVNAQERTQHLQIQKQQTSSTTLLPSIDSKLSNTDLNQFDLTGNSIIDTSSGDLSVEQDTGAVPSVVASGSSLPYDDQSAETINQHTNFIFNWHTKNSDISAIEPLHKPDLDILTIAALTELQKPLMFGVIAGTLLLAFILLLYFCMARQHRIPSDKAALIVDDVHSVVVSFPPAEVATSATHAGVGVGGAVQEEICRNPAICSRNALKV